MKQVQATKMEGWTSSAKQKLPQSSYRGSQASRLKKLEDFEYNRISHHKTCALWRSWWFTNIRIGVALPCPAMPCRFLAKYWWTMMNQENGLLNLADLHSEYQTDIYYSSTFWDPCELVSHHGKRMADTQKNATNAGGQDKQSMLFVILPHGKLGFRNGNLSWVVGVTPQK